MVALADQAYHSLFKPVVDKIMEVYQPEAVVLQCGEWGRAAMQQSVPCACVSVWPCSWVACSLQLCN